MFETEIDKDREELTGKRSITHYREEETVSRWEEDEDQEDADHISKFIYFEHQQYLLYVLYIFIRAQCV